jgi:predicted nucleic acid-binding Zn ribbon protein
VDEKLQDLLGSALRGLGVNGPVRDLQVAEMFAEVVGEALAPMCRAQRLERGTLVIGTTNSALSHQLQMESPRLIEELNRRLGSDVIRRFRFVPLS